MKYEDITIEKLIIFRNGGNLNYHPLRPIRTYFDWAINTIEYQQTQIEQLQVKNKELEYRYSKTIDVLKEIAGEVCTSDSSSCEECEYMIDTMCMFETMKAGSVLKELGIK